MITTVLVHKIIEGHYDAALAKKFAYCFNVKYNNTHYVRLAATSEFGCKYHHVIALFVFPELIRYVQIKNRYSILKDHARNPSLLSLKKYQTLIKIMGLPEGMTKYDVEKMSRQKLKHLLINCSK